MKFYPCAIQLAFGVDCVHAKVIKKTKRNRVVKVGTKRMIGSGSRWEYALEEYEDSTELNAAFIEGLNQMFRQGSSYLPRGPLCHAHKKRAL